VIMAASVQSFQKKGKPHERPDQLASVTYKIDVTASDGENITVYLTIADHQGKPFELFINSKNAKLVEHLNVLTVFGSRLLRLDAPVDELVADLMEITSPFTGHMKRGGWCNSLYARIGEALQAHARALDGEDHD